MLALRGFYRDGVPGVPHLLIEGVVIAVIGVAAAGWLFPQEASLVSVFLAAISAEDSIERLLDANRRAIVDRGEAPTRANARLTAQLGALFLGTFLGFAVLALSLPLERVELLFSHQVPIPHDADFRQLRFGGAGPLFVANLYVLFFFLLIALPFRHGGVMLAIAWNASVWGATFAVLARRWATDGGPGTIESFLRVMSACAPHMAMEGCAYTLAGLAGVFLSRGVQRHALDSPVLQSVVRSVGAMVGTAIVLVTIGAMWEGWVAPSLVRWVSG